MKALSIINLLKEHKIIPRLDEGNLKLTGNVNSLTSNLLEEVKTYKKEIIDFLLDMSSQTGYQSIPVIEKQAYYPLSNAQQRMWILSQFEGGSTAYNIVKGFYIEGTLIVPNLDQVFQLLIQRHEILRTVFREIDGIPAQFIQDQLSFNIGITDIRIEVDKKNYLRRSMADMNNWAFDLQNGPLLKIELLQLMENEYALIFGMHHIISDGWSIGVMVQEVMRNYTDLCLHESTMLPPLSIQYKDYAAWLANKLNLEAGERHKGYWLEYLNGDIIPIQLPADFTRPSIQSYKGSYIKHYFEPAYYEYIQDFCKKHQVTLFSFLQATVNILLHKLTGQEQVIVGTPVSGRNHFDLENQIGLYVNTIVLKTVIDKEQDFLSYLKDTHHQLSLSFEHQEYPFDSLVEELQIKRDTSRHPLFDVMIVLQNTAFGDGTIAIDRQHGFLLDDLDKYLYQGERLSREEFTAKFDLSFNFANEPGNRFFLELNYSKDLFKESTVSDFIKYYLLIIDQIFTNPMINYSSIILLNKREIDHALSSFNVPIGVIGEQHLMEILKPALLEHADKIALLTGEEQMTYSELDKRSDLLACRLLEIIPSGRQAFIGLFMERTANIVISVLAVFKAGLAYVPIDITHPISRIAYILEDSQPALILCDTAGIDRVPTAYSSKVMLLDDVVPIDSCLPAACAIDREQIAYLIYTSGSTGKPKGVQICHRNTIAFLKWAEREFKSSHFDLLYAATSYCFDLSVFEMLFPLLVGKTIRLLSSALEIPLFLSEDHSVMLNTVPSVVRSLLDNQIDLSAVTVLNMAGEAVPTKFKQLLDYHRMEIRNLYGPTEDTTYSTVYQFQDDGYDMVPIGRPIDYSHLYILDESMNLLPPNIEGEIYLSGQGIAKGYYNRNELTEKSFITNPFVKGYMMYRTGDTGKWLKDGNVIYTGRKDEQVKIRGYRIELGEITTILENQNGIIQALTVSLVVNGEQSIVAYWQGEEENLEETMKKAIAAQLPAYMFPSYWVQLDSFPLNSNGKVDKSRLPLPDEEYVTLTTIIPPSSEIERILLNIWETILGKTGFGIEHNFFDLGGHSLTATRLKARIHKELQKDISLEELFRAPTIALQANILEKKDSKKAEIIEKAALMAYYPVSFSQERLWVLSEFEEASFAYHMSAAFVVHYNLDAGQLAAALQVVINRHEILRTVLVQKDGIPVQKILPRESVISNVEKLEFERLGSSEALSLFIKELWKKPFDIHKGPLLRVVLIQTQEKEQVLSFDMHHIISDGWSIGVLIKELLNAYKGILPGSPLAFQYKDFAVWQRERLSGEKLMRYRNYWMTVLSNEIVPLVLPTDFVRPEVKTYKGSIYRHVLSPELVSAIRGLVHQKGASLFSVLVTALNILLHQLSGQKDIIIGCPVAGREYLEWENQIGMYVNTLPLRTMINDEQPFSALLKNQQSMLLKTFEYQSYPFEQLINDLQLKRDLSRSPVFDVVIALLHDTVLDLDNVDFMDEGLRLERLEIDNGATKYDLNFSFFESQHVIKLEMEYNNDLFLQDTVARIVQYMENIFFQVTDDPEMMIKDIRLLKPIEEEQLRIRTNNTKIGYDKTATIVSLFQHSVTAYPNHVALKAGNREISYKELDTLSGQLAKLLIDNYTIQPEELIVLCFDRNEWMLIAIMAVLKAGAAYVPVDPSYPEERMNYIIKDSHSRLILADGAADHLSKETYINCDFLNITNVVYEGQMAVQDVKPEHLAYVIYTSGTTGQPKGVMIEHRNVTRLFFSDQPVFDFNSRDRWSLFHSYCFDFSVWEMYGALLFGGTLVIVRKDTAQNSIAFFDFLLKEGITVLNQTPTAFRVLVQQNSHRFENSDLQVRHLIFGGEALMPEILKDWQPAYASCKIINMYGITETTVHVTYKEITIEDILTNKNNIGFPIPTLSCYVLDKNMQQVAPGVVGELCIGGAGVARGYLNQPALTTERFAKDPFNEEGRLYKSGDYARILPSGDLEYIGRIDHQVKIRGHRVELGEIESAFLKLQEIKDAVIIVLKGDNGEAELAAYYILKEQFIGDNLRNILTKILPSYAMPSFLIEVFSFPLTNNGKLDEKALPLPENISRPQTAFVPPRNTMDEQITLIWEEVLHLSNIGIQDNFFELGGHSLKATRVISMIHEQLGIKIDLKNIFVQPTIQHLSDYIDAISWMNETAEIVENSNNVDEIIL